MFKLLAIYFLAVAATVAAKPHLLAAGINYATPVLVASAAQHPVLAYTPIYTTLGYYPAYATSYATHPLYAVHPQLGGAAYFVRR